MFLTLMLLISFAHAEDFKVACLTPVATATEKQLKEFYEAKTKKNVKVTTFDIHQYAWVNGPLNKAIPAYFESIPYNLYNISLLLEFSTPEQGGLYRLDPLVQVRVNTETCEVFRVIALNVVNTDGREAQEGLDVSPADGSTYVLTGESQVIYSQNELPNIIESLMYWHRKYYPRQ
jgi:hypothetical protein